MYALTCPPQAAPTQKISGGVTGKCKMPLPCKLEPSRRLCATHMRKATQSWKHPQNLWLSVERSWRAQPNASSHAEVLDAHEAKNHSSKTADRTAHIERRKPSLVNQPFDLAIDAFAALCTFLTRRGPATRAPLSSMLHASNTSGRL